MGDPELAEAEKWTRDYGNGWGGGYIPTPGDVRRVMAELDRVRAENKELREWKDAQRRQNKALVAHIDGGMELWQVAEVLRDEQ